MKKETKINIFIVIFIIMITVAASLGGWLMIKTEAKSKANAEEQCHEMVELIQPDSYIVDGFDCFIFINGEITEL